MAADVAAYSRLVSEDEEGTLGALRAHRDELIDPQIAAHDGRIANTAGDSLLIEFASAVEAVRCALAIQQGIAERNRAVPEERQIRFRIGINVGDVLERDGDLLGEGVNVAARLESLAEPGEICVSLATRDQVRDRLPLVLDDQGEVQVKNIPRPVHVFRLRERTEADDAAARAPRPAHRRRRLLPAMAAAALLLAVGSGAVVYRGELTALLDGALAGPTTTAAKAPGRDRPAARQPPKARDKSAQDKPARVAAAETPKQADKPAPAAKPEPGGQPAQQPAGRSVPKSAPARRADPPAAAPPPTPAAAPADLRLDGLWAGDAYCEYGTSFNTRKFAFRVQVERGRADLELTGTNMRGSDQQSFRWQAALDAKGHADASTAAVTGRRVPVSVDLSADTGQGKVDFDGCVVALAHAGAAADGATAAAAAAPKTGSFDGRWTAYFDECGMSFGGAPLVYSIALEVNDRHFEVKLDVADTYEKRRATMSGDVAPNGRLEAQFETSMKTSEVQTLRADLSEPDGAWVTIDDCRRSLKPIS